jgi:hypothetical protein
MAPGDLWGTQVEEGGSKGKEVKWYLVSNHLNMMFMLAAGLIMPPAGFKNKYYQDTLSLVPGWIPLFPNKVSDGAVVFSVEEQQLLVPCCAEVNLSRASGPIKILRDGRWFDAQFPEGISGDEDLILVPAPLPVTWISEIGFRSRDDKALCEKSARDLSNVNFKSLGLKTTTKFFKQADHKAWPVSVEGLSEREVFPDRLDAAGGMIAALYHLSNRDPVVIDSYIAAYEGDGSEALKRYPMLYHLPKFFNVGETKISNMPTSAQAFWGLVEELIRFRQTNHYASARDVVLAFLERSKRDSEGKASEQTERLINDFKKAINFSDKTLSELMELYDKPLARAVLMFALKDHTSDLLEVKKSLLNGSDFSIAAILFGIRDGWLGFPHELRGSRGLDLVIPDFMARISHKVFDSGFDLGSAPERPKSLVELFMGSQWDKRQKEAALHLARKRKWDCIQTRVQLGKGDYNVSVDGSGVSIFLDGDIKAVEAFVDQDKFMTMLSLNLGNEGRVEDEVLGMLGVVK